jgi:hypothetical protein
MSLRNAIWYVTPRWDAVTRGAVERALDQVIRSAGACHVTGVLFCPRGPVAVGLSRPVDELLRVRALEADLGLPVRAHPPGDWTVSVVLQDGSEVTILQLIHMPEPVSSARPRAA